MSRYWKDSVDDFSGELHTCDCPLNYGEDCVDVSSADCQLWEQHVADRARMLIALGATEWKKQRRRKIPSAPEQLRKIEESLVSDI
ncbi:hypothetical protein D3C85_1190260 [compost metagenome]